MSSIRGIGDAYAFQRLLWLLVGTVIVPTILLSLFGVMAIRNQRAAILFELDRVQEERMEIGEAECIARGDPDCREELAALAERGEHGRGVLVRNAWLYPTSLVLLVGLVLVGTVVTLGSAAREIRLSRLQTDFVSSVSHELRTPLTSIRLFVETLQSQRLQDPRKVQECLDLLAHETDRLSRMIERVLDWARMEAGRRVYEFEPVPAAELAGDALRALRSHRLLEDDPDSVVVDVPGDLPEVRVDRDAIVEALLNLLQNAVKYTPQPRMILLRGRAEGSFVGLAVQDNGPGIPKRDRKRVFEKFYQVDTRLSSPAQGTVDRGSGLGLSIVRAVARAHGGRVDLDTDLGEGSTFTLWLPVATAVR